MNKQKNNNLGFTFVELIISAVIIILLSSIGFYSYVGYLTEARDSERKADAGTIKSSLKLYKQKRGLYPISGDYFSITNSGTVVAYQGKLNKKVSISTMDTIPLDPYTKQPYSYSTSKNKQEFQLAITLENNDNNIALLEGDYQSASINIIPSIVLAISSTTDVEVKNGLGAGTTNRQKFILNGGLNLPYSMNFPYDPVYGYNGYDLWTDVINGGLVNYWQNIDYRTCSEIEEAGKSIGDGEYQILSSTGALTNTGCTF